MKRKRATARATAPDGTPPASTSVIPNPLLAEGGVARKVEQAAREFAASPLDRKITATAFCREWVVAKQLGLPDFYVGMGSKFGWVKIARDAIGKDEWDRRIVKSKASENPELPPLPDPVPDTPAVQSAHSSIHARMRDAIHTRARRELRQSGGTFIRGLLSQEEAQELLRTLATPGLIEQPPTYLRETSGNGKGGAYHQINKVPRALQVLAEVVGEVLHDNGLEVMRGGKHLLLRYGLGAVNYAHQDKGDGQRAYQCVLMLSMPGVDFSGGATYVIDAASKVATELPYESAGDLLIFRAHTDEGEPPLVPARHFYHGMRRVDKGSKAVCSRVAVGLFQPA